MKILKTKDGFETVVDDEVYEWANKIEWRLSKAGYVSYRKGDARIMLHRLIAKTPEDYITDHINGNKLDNLISNLRVVTNKQNVWNNGLRSDNLSGYRGVCFRKDRGTWTSEIKAHGVKYRLGCYKTPEEAAVVYNRKAKELYGEFARLNTINK
jgi:hypothetical protein